MKRSTPSRSLSPIPELAREEPTTRVAPRFYIYSGHDRAGIFEAEINIRYLLIELKEPATIAELVADDLHLLVQLGALAQAELSARPYLHSPAPRRKQPRTASHCATIPLPLADWLNPVPPTEPQPAPRPGPRRRVSARRSTARAP